MTSYYDHSQFCQNFVDLIQGCHWSGKSQGNSRSGKSQGILEFVREFGILLKIGEIQEKSGKFMKIYIS